MDIALLRQIMYNNAMYKVEVRDFSESNHIILNDLLIFFEALVEEKDDFVIFNVNGFKFKYLKLATKAMFYKDIKKAYIEANEHHIFSPEDMLHKSSAYNYIYNYILHRMVDINSQKIEGKKAFSEKHMTSYLEWFEKYKKRYFIFSGKQKQFKALQYHCFSQIGDF